MRIVLSTIVPALLLALPALAQDGTPQTAPGVYRAKSASDKAHSEAEFSALAYMRTAVAAQKTYYRKHKTYADSLAALAGSGSFTRRMAKPDRGDYLVHYKGKAQGYSLTLTPRHFDDLHRSFYVDQSGEFRVEEGKPATASSPPLR
jgi:hypothetical protein